MAKASLREWAREEPTRSEAVTKHPVSLGLGDQPVAVTGGRPHDRLD